MFLFILFVVLTVILVAGAALIPHMWVLSCLVMLTFIALLVLHEVRRDRSLPIHGGTIFDRERAVRSRRKAGAR
jgi:hypothetical protein